MNGPLRMQNSNLWIYAFKLFSTYGTCTYSNQNKYSVYYLYAFWRPGFPLCYFVQNINLFPLNEEIYNLSLSIFRPYLIQQALD